MSETMQQRTDETTTAFTIRLIQAQAWDDGWAAAQRSSMTAPLPGQNPYRDTLPAPAPDVAEGKG